MTKDYIDRFNKDNLHEFVAVITVLAEKMDLLYLENEKLAKVKGLNRKYIVSAKNANYEFKKIKEVAEFLNVYTWEVQDLVNSGEEYRGYTVDYIEG